MSVYADYTAICDECGYHSHDREQTEWGDVHPRCPDCGSIVRQYDMDLPSDFEVNTDR